MTATAERLKAIGAGTLSDALGKTSAMDHQIQCRSANPRMAGPAYTLRVHTADILMVGAAVSACPAGHVLVIDGGGEPNTALWGGLITLASRLKGIAGVVIDGAIRDSAEIAVDELPVYAKSVVPNAGGAEYPGETEIAVACGGVVVQPGDWIVGDRDGVTVVPAAHLELALTRGEAIVAAERVIEHRIRDGEDLAAILRYQEKLDARRASGLIPQLRVESK